MTGLPKKAADLYVQLAEFMVLSEAKDRRFVPSERSEGLTLSQRRRGERKGLHVGCIHGMQVITLLIKK